MYLFDTNIFLEVILDQKNAQACEEALSLLDSNQSGILTSFSLHAIEAIVDAKPRRNHLKKFLNFIDLHPGLTCYQTTLEEEKEIADWVPKYGLDFDDTLQYYVARKQKLAIVTLDKDFKKIKDVPVYSPEKLVLEF